MSRRLALAVACLALGACEKSLSETPPGGSTTTGGSTNGSSATGGATTGGGTTGSATSTTGGGTTGSATSTTGGGTTGSATSTSSGGTTGGTIAPDGGYPYTGDLLLVTGTSAQLQGVVGYLGGAVFLANPGGANPPPFCPTGGVADGSCCYEPPGFASGAKQVGGGTIALSGEGGAALGSLTYSQGKGYSTIKGVPPYLSPNFKWKTGDTLKATNDGDTVHVFQGTVTAPGPGSNVAPAITSSMSIPRSQDLAVTWSASPAPGAESFTVVINDTSTSTQGGASLRCLVPDTAGQLTIPSTLLMKFGKGDSASYLVAWANTDPALADNAVIDFMVGSGQQGSATFGP